MIQKTCTVSGKTFEVTSEDVAFYEKMGVPIPTLCPEERQRKRLAWRNERTLYRRECSATGKSIISIFSKEKLFPVYAQDYWWSDQWDPLKYGQNFDFSRPFFEQFIELFNETPQIALWAPMSENSEYTNQCEKNKDCYLIFCSGNNRDCFCGMWFQNCRDSVDCTYLETSELCYEVLNGKNCYECFHSQNIENCSDCFFCRDCIGCKNCFGCVNLRNKEYYFVNEPLTKKEFQTKIKELELHKNSQIQKLQTESEKFFKTFPYKFYNGKNNEIFSGDYLQNNKQVFNSYNCRNSEKLNHCRDAWSGQNCRDITETLDQDFCLEIEGCYKNNDCRFCSKISVTNSVSYCSHCFHSSDLFGCVSLDKKKYCILNKQYAKEEYEKLRNKIIKHMKQTGEWGEFFPMELSPFAYNETVAHEYYPLAREDVLSRGWKWKDDEEKNSQPATIATIPNEISDSICKEILACKECKKNYRIQKQELKFYKKMNLPIPFKCPDCRHTERMGLRNPRTLYKRKCDKCSEEIQTTFAPDRPAVRGSEEPSGSRREKVYCEKCYLDTVN